MGKLNGKGGREGWVGEEGEDGEVVVCLLYVLAYLSLPTGGLRRCVCLGTRVERRGAVAMMTLAVWGCDGGDWVGWRSSHLPWVGSARAI